MSFRIQGLPAEKFRPLFALSDDDLKWHGALRRITQRNSPCRVSLTDAEPGQEVILVNFEHLPVDNPYYARYAIFVRAGEQTYDAVDQVPEQLRRRVLALRTWDAQDMMVGHEVVDGREIEGAIDRLFADSRAAYMHAHFAGPGCYAARIERA
ncbi:MAG: DUF1203 domain-containing protein [Proteobacteria bacterium]|nr:DUF1203 domain-containing protein [Pseudomonadota bacterium]